jgi:hypothetical protein
MTRKIIALQAGQSPRVFDEFPEALIGEEKGFSSAILKDLPMFKSPSCLLKRKRQSMGANDMYSIASPEATTPPSIKVIADGVAMMRKVCKNLNHAKLVSIPISPDSWHVLMKSTDTTRVDACTNSTEAAGDEARDSTRVSFEEGCTHALTQER